MTDQTLTDADLLAWAVIGEYRQRQRREGLTILLLPFPPCPTCGEQVYDAETSTVERGIDRISTINMAPCGHAYTVTDDEIERVHQHLADLVRRMEAADNSRDPNVRTWTTADVIRETQAAFTPAEHGRQMAVECFTVYRNDAKQLHATLAEVLDAFEAYWARADYCGPSRTAIQPEHFRAWRDMLRPETLDARDAEAAIARVRALHARVLRMEALVCAHCAHAWPCPTIGALDQPDPAATQATQPQEAP